MGQGLGAWLSQVRVLLVNDREISAACVAAWATTGVAGVLLIVAAGLFLGEHMRFAVPIGWLAIVTSAAASVAHVRSYFIAQNRMLRLLLAGHRIPEQTAELRPIR